jgi:hypothetical protein
LRGGLSHLFKKSKKQRLSTPTTFKGFARYFSLSSSAHIELYVLFLVQYSLAALRKKETPKTNKPLLLFLDVAATGRDA